MKKNYASQSRRGLASKRCADVAYRIFSEVWMRITLVAATALMAVMASPALAESKQDFDLVNRTGYTIDKVFVSPSNSKDWDDVLGRDVLGENETVHIRFHRAN